MGASSFTDTKAREKVVELRRLLQRRRVVLHQGAGGTTIAGIANICGMTVAVESGTTEETDAQAQSTKCTKAGKPASTSQVFPDQNRRQPGASRTGARSSAWPTRQSPPTRSSSHTACSSSTGAAYAQRALRPGDPEEQRLDKAVKAALLVLIKNGTYTKILNKWGVQTVAIPASRVKINGATS